MKIPSKDVIQADSPDRVMGTIDAVARGARDDKAIAADGTLTIAYLYKGGVYNRLERYNEALECYEQALRAQGGAA